MIKKPRRIILMGRILAFDKFIYPVTEFKYNEWFIIHELFEL